MSDDLLKDVKRLDLIRMERLLKIRDIRIDFASNHHRNTRDEPMQFDSYPHIRAVYNSVSPEIVLQGSVQSMKSEWAIIDHFAAAYSGLSVFFVIPKYIKLISSISIKNGFLRKIFNFIYI